MNGIRIRSQNRVGEAFEVLGRVSSSVDALAHAEARGEVFVLLVPAWADQDTQTWSGAGRESTGHGYIHRYMTGLNAGVFGAIPRGQGTGRRFAELRRLGQQIRNLSVPEWPDEMMDLARQAIEDNPEVPSEQDRRRWIARISEAVDGVDD